MRHKSIDPGSALEEIVIDEELERIEKWNREISFPAVGISGKGYIYFNALATQHIKKVEYLGFFSTSEYIILLPESKNSINAYKICDAHNGYGISMRLPSTLREKKLKDGYYKLYKYKDGFCFKRYEPLEGSDLIG